LKFPGNFREFYYIVPILFFWCSSISQTHTLGDGKAIVKLCESPGKAWGLHGKLNYTQKAFVKTAMNSEIWKKIKMETKLLLALLSHLIVGSEKKRDELKIFKSMAHLQAKRVG
jgi:hypothetical protein